MSAKLRQLRESGSEAKVAMADAAELHAEQVCVYACAALFLVYDSMLVHPMSCCTACSGYKL
jgi:hypothetical protein